MEAGCTNTPVLLLRARALAASVCEAASAGHRGGMVPWRSEVDSSDRRPRCLPNGDAITDTKWGDHHSTVLASLNSSGREMEMELVRWRQLQASKQSPSSVADCDVGNGRCGDAHDTMLAKIRNSQERKDIVSLQAKYERLQADHRKLQEINHILEERLLKIADVFESDKAVLCTDIMALTEKLIRARDSNYELEKTQLNPIEKEQAAAMVNGDVFLLSQLLKNFSTKQLNSKIKALPADDQRRVRACLAMEKMSAIPSAPCHRYETNRLASAPCQRLDRNHVQSSPPPPAANMAATSAVATKKAQGKPRMQAGRSDSGPDRAVSSDRSRRVLVGRHRSMSMSDAGADAMKQFPETLGFYQRTSCQSLYGAAADVEKSSAATVAESDRRADNGRHRRLPTTPTAQGNAGTTAVPTTPAVHDNAGTTVVPTQAVQTPAAALPGEQQTSVGPAEHSLAKSTASSTTSASRFSRVITQLFRSSGSESTRADAAAPQRNAGALCRQSKVQAQECDADANGEIRVGRDARECRAQPDGMSTSGATVCYFLPVRSSLPGKSPENVSAASTSTALASPRTSRPLVSAPSKPPRTWRHSDLSKFSSGSDVRSVECHSAVFPCSYRSLASGEWDDKTTAMTTATTTTTLGVGLTPKADEYNTFCDSTDKGSVGAMKNKQISDQSRTASCSIDVSPPSSPSRPALPPTTAFNIASGASGKVAPTNMQTGDMQARLPSELPDWRQIRPAACEEPTRSESSQAFSPPGGNLNSGSSQDSNVFIVEADKCIRPEDAPRRPVSQPDASRSIRNTWSSFSTKSTDSLHETTLEYTTKHAGHRRSMHDVTAGATEDKRGDVSRRCHQNESEFPGVGSVRGDLVELQQELYSPKVRRRIQSLEALATTQRSSKQQQRQQQEEEQPVKDIVKERLKVFESQATYQSSVKEAVKRRPYGVSGSNGNIHEVTKSSRNPDKLTSSHRITLEATGSSGKPDKITRSASDRCETGSGASRNLYDVSCSSDIQMTTAIHNQREHPPLCHGQDIQNVSEHGNTDDRRQRTTKTSTPMRAKTEIKDQPPRGVGVNVRPGHKPMTAATPAKPACAQSRVLSSGEKLPQPSCAARTDVRDDAPTGGATVEKSVNIERIRELFERPPVAKMASRHVTAQPHEPIGCNPQQQRALPPRHVTDERSRRPGGSNTRDQTTTRQTSCLVGREAGRPWPKRKLHRLLVDVRKSRPRPPRIGKQAAAMTVVGSSADLAVRKTDSAHSYVVLHYDDSTSTA